MNPEQLLAHFDRVSEVPDAIPRLRRFILELAVRGKLAPQDPNDEPAFNLLKRIVAGKAHGKKGQQDLLKIDDHSELTDLPRNWSLAPLIALGTWAIGAGFPKNEQGFNEGPYFFLKVSDMNLPGNEKYITTSNNSIDDDAAERIRAKIHPPGTIIFPKIGGAIATNKRRILTRGSAIDNNCLGITFSQELDNEWAYLFLTSIDLSQYQAGTAVPALQQSVLEQIPVSLPPLAEQHRIVAKVDELMALCDQLQVVREERERRRDRLAAASLSRIGKTSGDEGTFRDHVRFHLANFLKFTHRPDQILTLRKTILELAFRGKLVSQDPNDEPAKYLLERIDEEKERRMREGVLRISKPASVVREDEKAIQLPSGWLWVRMGQVIKLWSGYAFKSEDYQHEGIPVIRIGDLQAGFVDIAKAVCVSQDVAKAVGPDVWIPENALLIAMSGATTGKVAFNKTGLRLLLNQRVGRIEVFIISTEYVRFFFETIVSKNLNISFGTAIPNLSAEQINTTVFPMPPLAEQHRIVAKVDELMLLCDRLEAQLSKTKTENRRLLDVLLHLALEPALADVSA